MIKNKEMKFEFRILLHLLENKIESRKCRNAKVLLKDEIESRKCRNAKVLLEKSTANES